MLRVAKLRKVVQMKRTLSTLQVSSILGVAVASVSKWVDQGKIKAGRTPGGHRRIEVDDLIEFLRAYKLRVPPELSERLHSRPKILVVDDEASVRKLIGAELRDRHPEYVLLEACDGYQAGQMVGLEKPCAVILDLHMPGIDGLRICRQIKANPKTKGMAVVILSAFVSDAVRGRLLKAGANAVLEKPLDVDVVVREAEKAVARQASRR
jgi:excisionase family DNA binding protein